MTAAIDAEALSKTFGGGTTVFGRRRASVTAVRDVDLRVAKGETLGVVGESGCGKSTLARMLVGLERPSHGTVRLDGQNVRQLAVHMPRRLGRSIQYVFQSAQASLNPRMTIRAALAAPMRRLLGLDGAAQQQRLGELMGRVDLDVALLERYPHELSGGQAQRVAIARALAAKPGTVVLDEPVSSLDVSIQAQVLKLLTRLKQELSLTYVFISHDLAVVQTIADSVAVMYAGRIVELGAVREVMQSPRHPYTALLLACVPRLGGRTAISSGPSADPFPQPDDIAYGPGCDFAPRCPHATPVCHVERPPLVESAHVRSSACWHPL